MSARTTTFWPPSACSFPSSISSPACSACLGWAIQASNVERSSHTPSQIGKPMKCPQCKDTALVMSERQGIEIDYCPNCRGIWLDRGELDKLIEKASIGQNPSPQPSTVASPQSHAVHERVVYRDDSRHRHYKQKSWLSEIFD